MTVKRQVLSVKTKYWIALFALIGVLCLGLGIGTLWPRTAQTAQILSDGEIIATVSLLEDQQFTVNSAHGSNTVTVKNGQIAVTAATCPDHYCMKRGFCNGGAQIVCLPNRLVIRFLQDDEIDGVVG
jgi:hypothetical protein